MSISTFPIDEIRAQFPGLAIADAGRPRIYFDNPAGTQVPRQVIDRTVAALTGNNANLGGHFATTVAAGEIVDDAHQAMADFYNASSPRERASSRYRTCPMCRRSKHPFASTTRQACPVRRCSAR